MNDDERSTLTINYSGDVSADLRNRILGPDEFGAFYVVESTTYNGADNTTATKLRPATAEELDTSTFDLFGQRHAASD